MSMYAVRASKLDVVWRKASRSNADGTCVEVAALAATEWRKSARSGASNNCVEVATNMPGAVAIRDSKVRTGLRCWPPLMRRRSPAF